MNQPSSPSPSVPAWGRLHKVLAGPMQSLVWLCSLAGTGLLFWLDAQGQTVQGLTNQWVGALAVLGPVCLVLLLLESTEKAPSPA